MPPNPALILLPIFMTFVSQAAAGPVMAGSARRPIGGQGTALNT